jgi:hypothetical protein
LRTGFDAAFLPFVKRVDARGANGLGDRGIVMTAAAGRRLRAPRDRAGIDAQNDFARFRQQIGGRINAGAARAR